MVLYQLRSAEPKFAGHATMPVSLGFCEEGWLQGEKFKIHQFCWAGLDGENVFLDILIQFAKLKCALLKIGFVD